MDKQTFISDYNELESIRQNAECKLRNLRSLYVLENSPFRVGDQVKILFGGNEGKVGVIVSINVSTFEPKFGTFTFQVNQATKTGTSHPKRVLQYHAVPEGLDMVKKGPLWNLPA